MKSIDISKISNCSSESEDNLLGNKRERDSFQDELDYTFINSKKTAEIKNPICKNESFSPDLKLSKDTTDAKTTNKENFKINKNKSNLQNEHIKINPDKTIEVNENNFKNGKKFDEIIKSYHFIQEGKLVLNPEKNTFKARESFGVNDRYSRRKRFPKLQPLFGEKLQYEYKKGQLVETMAMININLKDNKDNGGSNNFKETSLFTIPPNSEMKFQNDKKCSVILFIVSSEGKNKIIVDNEEHTNLLKGESINIPPKGRYFIINQSAEESISYKLI